MSQADGAGASRPEITPQRMRLVVAASAAGTVFEWYDFFVYGAVATIMTPLFVKDLPDAQAFVFILLTFALGFITRPLGALVFGKIGDSTGRKGAFLTTILIMGLATFAIGLLPTADEIGIWAPILLVTCRVLQGFALGGEYGGAAIYVAEHALPHRRGASTAWIQTSASVGLIGALGVILATRSIVGEEAFRAWGWRVPFFASLALLAISVWIRLQLEESPAFQKLKEEGALTKRAYAESFLEWRNLRIVLLALFGLMMAQGVVWYTAHFYAQFYLERILKIASLDVNILMIAMVVVSAPLYMFFARLSDRVGRKPVMLFGMILMLCAYFPGFYTLTRAGNPALAEASARMPAVVAADPADCSFQLDLTGGARQFASSCDIAKSALSGAGVSYTVEPAERGALARIRIGAAHIASVDARGMGLAQVKAARADVEARLRAGLTEAGYPLTAEAPKHAAGDGGLLAYVGAFAQRYWLVFAMLGVFVIAATALYGPQAAALVELFPTRIRYTALSLPYNIGTGWFGGLLPATVFAINTATGNSYAGLWFPAAVTAIAAIICLLFWPETKDRDIHV